MIDTIHVGDLAFEVILSTRRKTVELGVERDGSLVVRAPTGIPAARLERFARQKRMWVYEKLARKAELSRPTRRAREFVTGEGFAYLGRWYRLQLVANQDSAVKLVHGRFRLFRREAKRARDHFVAWYAERGRRWLARRVAEWSPRLGTKSAIVEVRELGFRWGSCGRERVNFNWSTMTLPPAIIDYVIVHELAHLQHPHHGPAFWAAVSRAMPDHERRKRWLAENGGDYGL